MPETRSSESVEGVLDNHNSYSDHALNLRPDGRAFIIAEAYHPADRGINAASF